MSEKTQLVEEFHEIYEGDAWHHLKESIELIGWWVSLDVARGCFTEVLTPKE